MEFNKKYLDEVKQELVNTVAGTPYIVPEIFLSITDLPKPTVEINHHEEKTKLRYQRRKEVSQIWNDFPDDAIKLIRIFHEGELLTFLKEFPEFNKVIL